MKEGFSLKKYILIFFSVIILASCIFVSCSSTNKNNSNTAENGETSGLSDADTEYGFETEKVTDDKGKEVTDDKGKAVTKTVQVVYTKDEKGKYVAQVLDEKTGQVVTDPKTKEPSTIQSEVADNMNTTATTKKTESSKKPAESNNNSGSSGNSDGNGNESNTPDAGVNHSTTRADDPTGTTKKQVELTKEPDTTAFKGTEKIPKTSDEGKEVNFSVEDQETIASMLEVPYLYLESYENSDGIPIEIATHVAVWMAEREGGTSPVYPSSPVVLNLFKYFGQTVVNFKTLCNDAAKKSKAPIEYLKSNDTFTISEFTPKKQTVKITKIEDMGNNNFYKITANVDGCGKRKVVAIVQKNMLDLSLGFSIKALKWS